MTFRTWHAVTPLRDSVVAIAERPHMRDFLRSASACFNVVLVVDDLSEGAAATAVAVRGPRARARLLCMAHTRRCGMLCGWTQHGACAL